MSYPMIEAFLAPVPLIASLESTAIQQGELPEGAKRMLSAAVRLEDPDQLNGVVSAAKLAFPDAHLAIETFLVEMQAPPEPLKVEAFIVRGTPPEPPKYSYLENLEGRLDLNAAYTDGNTDTSNLGTQLKASLKRKANIHRVEAHANTGRANGQRTQENWGASYQMDTLWTDDVFGYARVSYESDQFSGFDYRAFLGAGAGYYFLQQEKLSLRGEVGPGYRYSRQAVDGDESGDWVIYGAIDTKWDLFDGWRIEHDSKLTLSEPSATVTSKSQLSTALTEALRAGLGYEIQFEEKPPNNRENLDTILKFNVS
jgi:putative salt-induced outer membrane protein YdiY